MRRVLITGAHGFLARHLASRLLADGDVVLHGLDLSKDLPRGFATYASVDVVDASEVLNRLEAWQPDDVYHLAALTTGSAPALYRANVLGTVTLLESLWAAAPRARVLLVGSAAEYGRVDPAELPIDEATPCRSVGPYGLSKYAATLAGLDAARRGQRVVVARPFNILGPGVSPSLVAGALARRMARALRAGEGSIQVGNLDTQRDFLAVEDVVEALPRLLRSERWGEVFNLCSGVGVPIRELAERFLSLAPTPLSLVVDPQLCRASDVPAVYGSYARAAAVIGFAPRVPLVDALEAVWRAEWEEAGCASPCK